MASMDSTEQQTLTCAVCLGIFTDPRFLECHHSFCTRCIEDVASRHGGGSLPCPSCRAQTILPPEGVTGLQKTFYISEEALERARAGVFRCKTHPKEDLDLYCVSCDVPVCHKCVLTKHQQHGTQNLAEAAVNAKKQLQEDQGRLQRAKTIMDEKIKVTENEQQKLEDKKNAVKQNIRGRHAIIVEAANRSRDQALAKVDDVTAGTERNLTEQLKRDKENRDTIHQLEQRVQAAVDSASGCEVVDVAREMTSGRGSTDAIRRLVPEDTETISRPVLRYETAEAEDAVRNIENYIGTPALMDMNISEQEGTAVEKFKITEQPGCEVFSLSVNNNGEVDMSYAWDELSENAACETFRADGSRREMNTKKSGKYSWKGRMNTAMSYKYLFGSERYSFSKSSLLSLHSNSSGTAKVVRTTVISEEPFKTKKKTEFAIQCGPHRAFDVDSEETLFAVVEEPHDTNTQRRVRVFIKSGNSPTTDITYTPPTQPFMPSDVCFFEQRSPYSTSTSKALLVADEVNDAIHVVDVRHCRVEFVRYLCPGHPQLIQPTALTVDSRNRLWVACRGRVILIMEPRLPGLLS